MWTTVPCCVEPDSATWRVTLELGTTRSDSAWVKTCDLCALLHETEVPEHRYVSISFCAGLANTQVLNHHDPAHVTSFLRLTDIVRLFRGSTAFRPTFAPLVSCLAKIPASTFEFFLIRLAFPRTLSFLILLALSFALAFGLSFALVVSFLLAFPAFFVNEINVRWVISLHEFETFARFRVLIDCLTDLEEGCV